MYHFRDRFDLPLKDKQVEDLEFYKPNEKSEEIQYLKERREKLEVTSRLDHQKLIQLNCQKKTYLKLFIKTVSDREFSTTMALVNILTKIF